MIAIDQKKINIWSKLGSRATFGLACLDFVKSIDNLFIITADVSTSAGLDRFRKQYKDNYLDVGIAEQNMMSVAAGMASEGMNVITTTFSTFQTMRCYEQIRVNLGYMNNKVTMVGLASGLVLGNLGFTHCNIEDISIMRAIPNVQVLSPCDALETVKCIEAGILSSKPSYVRLTGGTNLPIVYENDYEYRIGEAINIREGDDITLFGTGTCVQLCIDVHNKLKERNIHSNVINIHTIKPIDKKTILSKCLKSKLIISVEEHSVIGGLGSAVAEINSSQINSPKHILIGVNDNYGKCGDYNFMKNKYGLTPDSIYGRIIKEIDG